LRARQHWHAFDALLFTALVGTAPSKPAAEALRFGDGEIDTSRGGVDSIEMKAMTPDLPKDWRVMYGVGAIVL
jgi:hypothetical protein